MRISVRFFLLSFFLIILGFFGSNKVFAQTPTTQPIAPNQAYAPNTNPGVPNNLHTLSQGVFIEILSAMNCQLAGYDPSNPHAKCLGIDPKTNKIGYVENGGGLIGLATRGITLTLAPPIHTKDYIQYLSSNFGIAKHTYAATTCDPSKDGEGFCGLQPLLKMWTTFRDIGYLLFVLIFLVIGFGIMFRLKIDAQTVMAVENQLPKLIMTIIMITFSFAVAGFLIDFMWLVIYLFIGVLAPLNSHVQMSTISGNLYNNPLGFVDQVYSGGVWAISQHGAQDVSNAFHAIFAPDNISGVVNGVTPSRCGGPLCGPFNFNLDPGIAIGNLVQGILAGFLSFIVNILATFVILIALFVALIKLWFALIQAYVFIIFDVVFAPFWIMGGLVPGGGDSVGFGAWFRDIFANLAVFPATIMMLLIGTIVLDSFSNSNEPTQFLPPLIAPHGGLSYVGPLAAFGILLAMPHMLASTRAALKAPKIALPDVKDPITAGFKGTTKLPGFLWHGLTKKPEKEGEHAGPLRELYRRHVTRPIGRRVNTFFRVPELNEGHSPIAKETTVGQTAAPEVKDTGTRPPVPGEII